MALSTGLVRIRSTARVSPIVLAVCLHSVDSLFRNRLLRDGDSRQIDRRLRLQSGQGRAHLWTRQLSEGTAVVVEIRKEGPNPRVDLGSIRRVRRYSGYLGQLGHDDYSSYKKCKECGEC